MMKIVFGAALSAAAFFAWQYWDAPIGDLTASEARVVADALAEGWGSSEAELREPIVKRPDRDGWFVCGWVRIGGRDAPLGSQPFVGLLFRNGSFSPVTLPVTQGEFNAVKEVCASRGLYL